jgi:hypothetical protein
MTAHDPTICISDYASATIGTDLAPRLLAEANRAAAESRAAVNDPDADPDDQLQKCLVAILCAAAAVEGQMNSVGDALDAAWWKTQEPRRFLEKWKALAERRTGQPIPDDDPTLAAVARLNRDRNQVAHFRGLRQPDDTFQRSGPPVDDRGGISPVRAYFDANRASAAIADAEEAFAAL